MTTAPTPPPARPDTAPPPARPRPPLVASGVVKRFGGVVAVDGVDVAVPAGRVTAVIGPNGAGKTTLFDCLTGHQRPDGGRILLDGDDVTAWDVAARGRAGLGRTFQRLEVFTGMTVFENLLVAAEVRHTGGFWRELLRPLSAGGRAADTAEEVLDQIGLGPVTDVPAAELPTGTLRMLELGRALCTRPRVLLLDEPASGLDASETAALRGVLADVTAGGVGVLLVEHDVELVLDVSDHVYVLDLGRVVADGPPADVRDDPEVRRVYLGAGVR